MNNYINCIFLLKKFIKQALSKDCTFPFIKTIQYFHLFLLHQILYTLSYCFQGKIKEWETPQFPHLLYHLPLHHILSIQGFHYLIKNWQLIHIWVLIPNNNHTREHKIPPLHLFHYLLLFLHNYLFKLPLQNTLHLDRKR